MKTMFKCEDGSLFDIHKVISVCLEEDENGEEGYVVILDCPTHDGENLGISKRDYQRFIKLVNKKAFLKIEIV